jgi:hypothetical protein
VIEPSGGRILLELAGEEFFVWRVALAAALQLPSAVAQTTYGYEISAVLG